MGKPSIFNLLIEAGVIGFLVVIFTTLASIAFRPRSHLVTMFIAGASLHLFFEFMGWNFLYCKKYLN